ncbi:MAG: hypothetical protein P1U63_04230 [Coxiellaceae bacterium]|nr:hypothetical protein [Coxiellaceae bacterium]
MRTFKRLVSMSCALATFAMTSAYAEPIIGGEAKFGASIYILSPLKVEKNADLIFGGVLSGKRDVTVDSASPGVAKFSANGNRDERILVKVVESSVTLRNGIAVGPNNEVKLDGWNYGGSIKANGVGKFDTNGSIQDIRVGAVAHVLENTSGGNFRGIATLRVIYL